jgi:hypothetical protein
MLAEHGDLAAGAVLAGFTPGAWRKLADRHQIRKRRLEGDRNDRECRLNRDSG